MSFWWRCVNRFNASINLKLPFNDRGRRLRGIGGDLILTF